MRSKDGKLPSQFPAKVCEQRCSTCVFGPNTPLSKEAFRAQAQKWRDRGHQICHHHGTAEGGEDVWCRGFYETQVSQELRESFEQAGWIVPVPCDP